ncbi:MULTISPECIES: universal stress protein [Hymenobacter]|uniref:Universal stress protein n=1 Tax=Hymenobacter jejuensis TaxID=2502781 RepID=A0A5B8A0W9_9BACT|nr:MULTISPECIES: universal stress protein [Hymenobacter]MBC6990541.1 universal stress protein [Hymenobacter sp. BT491]QDA61041.1 universal stress protein [Hymenobacter jejuensis]
MTQNLAQTMPSAVPAEDKPVLSLIVLTNFMPAAHRAIRYAAELATPIGAQVVLLHVREVSELEGELLPHDPEREGELRMAVQTLADELYKPASIELVPDLQFSTAAALAKRYAPALFVLGRTEESAEEGLVNTAVLEVLRTGQFPLLLVPETYHGAATPKQVLVAADGEPFTLDKPKAALQLLKEIEPRMTVVTVSMVEDDEVCAAALHQVKVNGLADAASHTTLEVVKHAFPVHGILKAVTQTGAEMVVLLARRRSFLGAMFHRSVTNRLLSTCPVPMLVLPTTDS